MADRDLAVQRLLVACSGLFKSMFAVDGVANGLLIDLFWAKALIITAITWRWTGFNMVINPAATQDIDPAIYEAARIDGVPARTCFFRITIPMLKPVILFITALSTIGALQLFDEVNNITASGGNGGAPADASLTLSLYICNLTFRFMPSSGYAATISWLIVILVGLLSWGQFRVARDR